MFVQEVVRLHLIHTNDIHSRLEAAAGIHTLTSRLIKEIEGRDEGFLLLDIGDHMDRERMETEGTDGRVNVSIMAETGYHAVTLGNNELLTFSRASLDRLYETAPFFVVATNVTPIEGNRPAWLRPWAILQCRGVRVGLLGATIPYPMVYEMMGWQVHDPFLRVQEAVQQLRNQVDVLVLLSHLGLPNDRQMAEEVPHLDIILGGHTHHLMEKPERIGQTWIMGAGKFGQYVGHLTLSWDARYKRVAHVEGTSISTEGVPLSKEVLRRIAEGREEAEQFLADTVTTLNQPLSIDWHSESPLGNLLSDALRDWVGTDIALVNAGQVLDNLPAGPVTRRLLHRILPHPINPCRLLLTGKQLRRILEESLLEEFQTKALRGFGFRGEQLGILNVSGMDIEYCPEAPPYQKIRTVRIGGRELEADRDYSVATIDMFTFGVGYPTFQEAKEVRYLLPEFLRDVLAHWIRQPGAVNACKSQRWHQVQVCPTR
jgi:5'-nucleotidase